MSSLVTALLAGASVLLATGATRRWPWRIADLDGADPDPADPDPADIDHADLGRGDLDPRKAEHRAADSLERDLPAAMDLLVLSVSAGHSLHTAVVTVARTGSGPVADALRQAVQGFERGGRLADELALLPARHGTALQPLVATLSATLASGAPVAPALQRLADAERRRRRRVTEERVRRLPVVLLAPLVGLVLPAFVVVTIVPVALTTARSATFAAARPAPAAPVAPDVAIAPTAPDTHPDFPLPS